METNPDISYICNFARRNLFERPVVRTSQLNAKYDKMARSRRRRLTRARPKFLAATFPDRVVVAVTFHANVQEYESFAACLLDAPGPGDAQHDSVSECRQREVEPGELRLQGRYFSVHFPRPKQLNPNEKVGVEFVHPTINVIRQQRVLQEFSLKKMLVNGEPVL